MMMNHWGAYDVVPNGDAHGNEDHIDDDGHNYRR